jgi:hypothetical protein
LEFDGKSEIALRIFWLWRRTTDDQIEIYPVEEFLQELWNGKLL